MSYEDDPLVRLRCVLEQHAKEVVLGELEELEVVGYTRRHISIRKAELEREITELEGRTDFHWNVR